MDLNQTQKKNLEWELRLRAQREKDEAERVKWGADPESIQKAYETLLSRTKKAMTKPPIVERPPVAKALTLEELLTPEDYALLAGMQISLGVPSGSN